MRLGREIADRIRDHDREGLERALDAEPKQCAATDHEGYTLLHVAADCLDADLVDCLLDRGADVNARSVRQETPLMVALKKPLDVGNGTISGVVRGAFVTQQVVVDPAAPTRRTRVVRRLLDRGAHANPAKDFDAMPPQSRFGYAPPLTLAARLGETRLVKLLLDRGANVNGRCFVDSTALIEAVNSGYPDVMDQLLRAGADPNAHDQRGQTALYRCVAAASYAVLIATRPSTKGGWLPRLLSPNAEAPARHEAEERFGAMMQRLLAAGARIDARTDQGWTPLHIAINEGLERLVELCLAAGAEVDSLTGEQAPILVFLAEKTATRKLPQLRMSRIARRLIAAGADPRARGPDGRTAAQCAAHDGCFALALACATR